VAAAGLGTARPVVRALQAPPPGAQVVIGSPGARFAVPDCVSRPGDEAGRQACQQLTQVLRADLKFDGFFSFIPETLMGALPKLDPENPNYDDWRSVGANFLAATRAQVAGGELVVELRVYAVDSRQVALSKRYSGRADNPRTFAHQASDEIVGTIAQQRGVARTKIAFASDRDATKEKRAKELYIMDYDGHNPRRVTVNQSLNILPNWNPDGRSLAYVSYRQGVPDIFTAWIYDGRSARLNTGGQSFAPAFSPDGKRIAYASSRSGNMEIWIANADGTGAHKITSSPASDTAPTWSPTGNEIAFTSDRSSTPQIYVMDSEGLNVRRLTTVGSWNDAASWNPSREVSEIAYTARLEAGGFDIAIVDLAAGRPVRQITSGRGSCEYPSWAPSGRHLVFSCRRGSTWQITIADREGRSFNVLGGGPGNNVQPDWGP
jgi:TolB protein